MKALRHRYELKLFFIDLDGFKQINDDFGHDVGDAVLCESATRILNEVRSEDIVARIGGDEFVLLFTQPGNDDDVDSMALRILKSLEEPIKIAGAETSVSASIGIASFPQDGTDLERLLKVADKAMYSVKKSGKNGHQYALINDIRETAT